MSSPPVLLIGLDGVGFSEIEPWIEDGDLPNLASLMDEGVTADLQSTTPPWTPCAWPSLLSGRNPGEHGVFDFFTMDNYKKSLATRTDVDVPYLWEVFDAVGKSSVVVNFPLTHPVSNLKHGAVVPGYLAPEDTAMHPPDIRKEYERQHGEYKIYPESEDVESYQSVARSRGRMAALLNERFEWDLLAVQFQVTDGAFHEFDSREAIRRVFRTVDECIGDLINLSTTEPVVFVASDHGMGDYEGSFYVNTWLKQAGYCRSTTGQPEYFTTQKRELKDHEGQVKWGEQAVKAVTSTLSQIGVSPASIHELLNWLRVDGIVERILPDDLGLAAQQRVIDWEESKAFQILFNSNGIHIHVGKGGVHPSEYDDMRQNLVKELVSVTDPNGQPVFDEVHLREDIYEGRNLDKAPDIILVPRDYRYAINGTLLDCFRLDKHKNHKPNGIFLASGPDIETPEMKQASIYDVAPTIAATLGVPVDDSTDGTVLPVVETDQDRQSWRDIASTHVNDLEDEEFNSVNRRLAELGYME